VPKKSDLAGYHGGQRSRPQDNSQKDRQVGVNMTHEEIRA